MFLETWSFNTANSTETIMKRLEGVSAQSVLASRFWKAYALYFMGKIEETSFRLAAMPILFGRQKSSYYPILSGEIYKALDGKNHIQVTAKYAWGIPLEKVRRVFEAIVCDFYYETHYPMELCLEYMTHTNIADLYRYEWIETQDGHLFTFRGGRGDIWTDFGKDAVGSTYYIQFNRLKEGTGMRIGFVEHKNNFNWYPVIVPVEDVHMFWQRKLGMELKRIV